MIFELIDKIKFCNVEVADADCLPEAVMDVSFVIDSSNVVTDF